MQSTLIGVNSQSRRSRKSKVNGNIKIWMDYFKIDEDFKCDFLTLGISVNILKLKTVYVF